MAQLGRKRQPRYILSTEFEGKRMFLSEISKTVSSVAVVTFHTPEFGMAKHFTKYMAEKLRLDLSCERRQYEVEPLRLS
jgi:hypothetical protein